MKTEKVTEVEFPENFLFCPKMGKRDPNLAQNRFSWAFINFFHYFCRRYPKTKTHTILCFPVQTPYLGKLWFSSKKPLRSHPTRLQDILIMKISERNGLISLFFCMEMSIKESWHLQLLSRYAQSRSIINIVKCFHICCHYQYLHLFLIISNSSFCHLF